MSVPRLLPSDAVLIRLLNQRPKLTYRTIGARYGVSKRAVQGHADRLIVLGLVEARNRRPRPLSQAMMKRQRWLRTRLREGATQGQIARDLRVSRSRVSRMVVLMELAP